MVIVALTFAAMFQRSAAFDPDAIGKNIVVPNRKAGFGGQGQIYKARIVGSNPFASDEALGYAPVNGEFMLKKFDSIPDRIASANERQLMELVSQDDSGDDVRRIVNFHGAALESTGEFFVAMEKLDHDLSKYTVPKNLLGHHVVKEVAFQLALGIVQMQSKQGGSAKGVAWLDCKPMNAMMAGPARLHKHDSGNGWSRFLAPVPTTTVPLVKLIDIGLAITVPYGMRARATPFYTVHPYSHGTPGFLPPEAYIEKLKQKHRKGPGVEGIEWEWTLDPYKFDTWAFGVTMIEMFVDFKHSPGRLARQSGGYPPLRDPEWWAQAMQHWWVINGHAVPGGATVLLKKCLNPDPAQRPRMHEVIHDLYFGYHAELLREPYASWAQAHPEAHRMSI